MLHVLAGGPRYRLHNTYQATTKRKQVRFAEHDFFHSTSSSTPMKSTTNGLPGPMPYVPLYMTTKPFTPRRPHRYLDMSAVTWDMRDHQSTLLRKHHSISSLTCSNIPATNPPLRFLSITSPHLPWTINVYALNDSFVTVEDVLASIYRSLRINVL